MIGTEICPGHHILRGWRPAAHLGADALIAGIAWERPVIRAFGRETPIPREVAWFGAATYSYSGVTHAPAEMPQTLEALRLELEALTGARFNTCLANLYRSGSDSVAWHSDDEAELGPEPTIASVSLGASRRFSVRMRPPYRVGERIDVMLGHGDLVVMSGRSQADYEHCVPKTAREVGPRVNLTYRWING